MEKLLIIDGHNLLFRMFYGMPNSIKNAKSEEIKGVIGFIGGVKKLIKQFKTNKVIVIFDCETSTINKIAIDSNYKQNRPDYGNLTSDENPFTQLPYIYQILTYLGITHFEAVDAEADDYISSICEKYQNDYHCIIVSTDKDFFQLVNKSVCVYNPMSKVTYTEDKVFDRFHVTPEQMIDYKVLVGDASDNIKGVPLIGPKTAEKILSIGSIEQIIRQEVLVEERIYRILIENQLTIERNRKLITMNRHLPVNIPFAKEMNEKVSLKLTDILSECGVV